ncbi:MAG: hypothetical protein IJD31_00970 [Lachnospiraceae bacterium]|nr:hypothetical protein [Lachnospiraceae bacterium]
MIVKFDHISFSCTLEEEKEVRDLFKNYEIVFHEEKLRNSVIKKDYMRAEQELHNIMLLNSQDEYPIEITAYPKCISSDLNECVKYELVDDYIVIYSVAPTETERFLKLLGMKQSENSLWEIKPFLDKRKLKIKVCKTEEKRKVYLDNRGYGSLAFLVDNICKQKKLLENSDISCSDIDELMVNGKMLKIFFASSITGEIIEFIGLR